MTAYYNEIDPFAADWLRELIRAGHIAPGIVDTRSIEDVMPSDLAGFVQCHFFAGIGVWSYALRCAGWPDDSPVWTGSCPCQPFSAAGKGAGFADERHLWPAFHHLISQCRPATVFGEQVASKDGLAWFDLVQADLEGAGYACGAVDTCAAGFGAPHIRQRLYWVADAACNGSGTRLRRLGACEQRGDVVTDSNATHGVEHPLCTGLERLSGHGNGTGEWQEPSGSTAEAGEPCGVADSERDQQRDGRRAGSKAIKGNESRFNPCGRGTACRLDNTVSDGCGARWHDDGEHDRQQSCPAFVNGGLGNSGSFGRQPQPPQLREHGNGVESGQRKQIMCVETGRDASGTNPTTGPTGGFWGVADWLLCRDGKWRAVEPGTFPLAHGAPARVGRLRGYGNAIVAPQAEAFVRAYMETVGL